MGNGSVVHHCLFPADKNAKFDYYIGAHLGVKGVFYAFHNRAFEKCKYF